jgi:hypothetical protein
MSIAPEHVLDLIISSQVPSSRPRFDHPPLFIRDVITGVTLLHFINETDKHPLVLGRPAQDAFKDFFDLIPAHRKSL